MQGSIPCLRFALLLTPPTATASYPQLSPLHYILCPLGRALGAGGTPLSHHSWHHPPHSCCHSCSRGGGSGPAEEGPAPATATGGLQRAHLLCHSWYSWHRPPPGWMPLLQLRRWRQACWGGASTSWASTQLLGPLPLDLSDPTHAPHAPLTLRSTAVSKKGKRSPGTDRREPQHPTRGRWAHAWGLRLSGFSPLRYSCGRLSLEVLPPSSCILQWCLFPAELR